MYRITSVDGSDEDIRSLLRVMHSEIFADTAPQIDPDEGDWWIAWHGDEPVGFAGMSPSAAVANAGYLSRSGVHKTHRGRGLQRRMIRCRETAARRYGWSILRTDTTENIHSANSLMKAGYMLFEPTVPWAFSNSLYWMKTL